MADRFVYVPVIGLFLAFVWGASELLERLRVPALFRIGIAVIPILALIPLGAHEVTYWKNEFTLFERARTATRDNYMAYTAIGSVLTREGKIDEAMHYFDMAKSIQPNFADIYFSIAVATYKGGNLPATIANLEQAQRLKPSYVEARLNLALALQPVGRPDKSIENYRLVLQKRPDSEAAHLGIGNALLTSGRSKEAVDHFREAIRLNPKSAGAMARLAWILATHADAGVRNGSEALGLAQEA